MLTSAIVAFVATALARAGSGQLSDSFSNFAEHPAIDYRSTPPDDAVARLNRRIADGSIQLKADGASGYLRSVLDALNVPIESQVAVFNQDSLQRARISRENPRTLFFNDHVAVGWVRGGFIELAAQDPKQGVVFYVLDPTSPLASSRQAPGRPQFTRREDCLSCHYSYSTAGVPGMLARSEDQFTVDHTLPLERRWGGWYVTGNAGAIRHLGTSVEANIDNTGYLSTHSDIVALMVFDHQMHMMNLLSRIGWEARVAMAPAERQFDAPVSVTVAAREVVDYLLFVDEAPLTDTLTGSSGFAEQFAATGPRDRQGRSLRQLDLRQRLMRYPCSYMIYADVFDALPETAKDAIYRRMWQVLSGAERDGKYARLALDDRRAIVEILRETKAGLPDYFGAVAR
jgi:hypothetical protein